MKANPKVDAFLATLNNPFKNEMQALRKIILSVSPKITEDIKWAAPSFFYKDNMATFNPRAKKHVTLIFHKGSLINDTTGLLEGETKLTRTARFYDMADVKTKKKDIEKIVNGWIEAIDKIK